MFDRGNLTFESEIFVYDGSWAGLMTCVFEAYQRKVSCGKSFPVDIVTEVQESFIHTYVTVQTDEKKSERVSAGITGKIGREAFHMSYRAFMANAPGKEIAILRFLALGFKVGRNVLDMMADSDVLTVQKLSHKSYMEACKLFGFVRFEELEGNLFYSEVEPVNNVLEVLAYHFEDRFPNQNWIICDKRRGISAVYSAGELFIINLIPQNLPPRSEFEQDYRKLWRKFFETITIQERKNPKLQRQLMPKQYWKHMFEMEQT